ncbi:hypothetical protein [Massilia sp. NR 4-1]|uniref:hypothetical protein n=1 Tax=Massilia sp. NR 4-1 TaxID=1678028 RepID=UPI00067B64CE|nr:hypothetical protein [Massilia sp. NR 4-1]AKU23494.1 hypothetical protein ACZ75_20580 [Massilia sp. NR 4-1]
MFSAIVDMYRGLGRPEVRDDVFVFDGKVAPAVIQKIQAVRGLPTHFGYFEVDDLQGDHFNAEFCLPASEAGRFHASVAAFIEVTPSLNFGDLPAQFYIQDIDFYSGDPSQPEQIAKLHELCRFIKGLSALASNYNAAPTHIDDENRLLFVLAADGKSPAKTLALSIKIAPTDLDTSLSHVKLVELLGSDKVKDEIHVEERRSIMRLAVAEVLATPEDQTHLFSYLVKQWRTVLEKYRHNVLAFVSQYAFEKVRKEIATAEVDHATKLSGVLGDIAGKLLALPVSLGAIILLRKAGTREEFWILFTGLCVVSIIFGGVLWNQWLQVKRLRGSFDFIFGQYNEDAFPKKLRLPIATAKANIGRQYLVLKITFLVFGALALLPALGAIYIWVTPLPWSLADVCILFSAP